MKEQTGHFEGEGSLELFYKAWLPDSPPRAVLVIIHGSGEHIDRYSNLVQALVPAGILITGFDQRGHGRSEGQRGHIDSWDEYRQDIHIFLTLAVKLAPGLPVFLYGHSQGSLEALDYILHDPEGLAGAIISGTALDPKDAAPPHLVLLARILSRFAPRFPLKVNIKGASLSRDPQVAEAYDEDPLVHLNRSTRWGTETLKIIEWIKPRAGDINMPVLFLHGQNDPLLSADGAQRFFDQIPFNDKTIHIYPEGLHEPHNDLDYKQVGADIHAWIDRHIATTDESTQSPISDQ